jgi:ribosomal protein L37AE/L43A
MATAAQDAGANTVIKMQSNGTCISVLAETDNCKDCGRSLQGNIGGHNGYCSDCYAVLYAATKRKRCPKCGHEWVYRGQFKVIKCSQCNFTKHDEEYLKEYHQSPKYKAYEASAERKAKRKAIRNKPNKAAPA